MAFTVEIKVVPGSGRKAWMLDKSGGLKCYLKSPAEHGKANEELIKNLSKQLSIPQDRISISSGAQSRKKCIRIEAEKTYIRFLELLGIDWQMDMFS